MSQQKCYSYWYSTRHHGKTVRCRRRAKQQLNCDKQTVATASYNT